MGERPKGGEPEISLFFPLPPHFSFFLPSLGVFSLNCGHGQRRSPPIVRVWASLGSFCVSPGAPPLPSPSDSGSSVCQEGLSPGRRHEVVDPPMEGQVSVVCPDGLRLGCPLQRAKKACGLTRNCRLPLFHGQRVRRRCGAGRIRKVRWEGGGLEESLLHLSFSTLTLTLREGSPR